jgi:hypothetical protein
MQPQSAYLPQPIPQGNQNRIHRQRVDTNVVEVKLDCLAAETEIATGDPVICTGCHTILNSHSKLIPKPDPSEYIWLCEFCETNNGVNLEEPEIPRSDELTYIIENPQVEEIKEDESYVIFCIDISGSMCVTKPVSSKLELKTSKISEL